MKFRGQRSDDDVEINLISLIDVLLFLVIFFMVSTTFVEKTELAITLPQASTAEPSTETDKIEIGIDASGRCYVNGQALINTQLETILTALEQAAQALHEPILVINADAAATHQSVVTILDAARRLGLVRITFAAEITEEGDGAN